MTSRDTWAMNLSQPSTQRWTNKAALLLSPTKKNLRTIPRIIIFIKQNMNKTPLEYITKQCKGWTVSLSTLWTLNVHMRWSSIRNIAFSCLFCFVFCWTAKQNNCNVRAERRLSHLREISNESNLNWKPLCKCKKNGGKRQLWKRN